MRKYLFAIGILLAGCGYNDTKLPKQAIGLQREQFSPKPKANDFATVKAQVFQPYCLRCHSNAGGNKGKVNLETYANVMPIAMTILRQVESGSMPPAGPIPDVDKEILARWVEAGAPETNLQVIWYSTEGDLK